MRKPAQKGDKETGKQAGKPARAPKTKTAEKPEAKKRGRPSTFDQAVADEICERLSDGEPLREICRDERMPAWRTVYGWKEVNADFSARIARGREMGEEAIFQDCLRIADTPLMGEEIEESENGKKVKRGDMLGHRKLQIETRLKLLAKWNPKKWGDKLDLNHGGQDGENPIEVRTKVVIVPPKQKAENVTRPIDEAAD